MGAVKSACRSSHVEVEELLEVGLFLDAWFTESPEYSPRIPVIIQKLGTFWNTLEM